MKTRSFLSFAVIFIMVTALSFLGAKECTNRDKSPTREMRNSEYANFYQAGFRTDAPEGSDGFYWDLTKFRFPQMPDSVIDDYIFLPDDYFAEKYYQGVHAPGWLDIHLPWDILYIVNTWDDRIYISSESGSINIYTDRDELPGILSHLSLDIVNSIDSGRTISIYQGDTIYDSGSAVKSQEKRVIRHPDLTD